MTTIIWTGKKLVADTQATAGSFVSPLRAKKIMRIGKYAVATAGAAMTSELVIKLLKKHLEEGTLEDVIHEPLKIKGKEANAKEGSMSGAFVLFIDTESNEGLIYRSSNDSWDRAADPMTLGTGGKIALGAFLAGADAEEAVRIASTIDTATNDELITLDWSDGTWLDEGAAESNGFIKQQHRITTPGLDGGIVNT